MIQDLIDTALILESLEATSKTEAIDEMLAAAVAHQRLTKAKLPSIRKKIAEREHLGSTGIGNGVAVPHVKIDSIDKTLLILGRSVEGIDFEAVDGRPVQTVFLIVAPGDAAADHLKLLRWVSGLARSADFRRFFSHADGEAGIRELLQEMSGL
jgi:mannitol/fructose-specific phosphotransferase system IIA component (Ntr-type)